MSAGFGVDSFLLMVVSWLHYGNYFLHIPKKPKNVNQVSVIQLAINLGEIRVKTNGVSSSKFLFTNVFLL